MRPIVLKRLLLALLVVALGVGAWLAFQRANPEIAVNFTQSELQVKLAERFPVERCAPLNLACFIVREPKLALKEGSDRIDVSTSFALKVGNREYPGSAAFNTKIRYAQSEGAFFLDDVKITQFSTEGKLGDLENLVKSQGDLLIGTLLRTTPVYKLKNETDSRAQAVAKSTIRDVKIENGKLKVVLYKN
jgi:hypothetical protein